jgi:hypothetical protein
MMKLIRNPVTARTALPAALLLISIHLAGADPAVEFREKVLPILEKNCFDCHDNETQKADLNLFYFSDYQRVLEAPDTWKMVYERVHSFEMPPGKRELRFNDQRFLVQWLRKLPQSQEPDCHQLASDRTQNFYRGYVMSRRLNRAEYNHSIRDLFGVDLQLHQLLPADGGGGEGFDTAGNALFTSAIHIEKYLEAAGRALEQVLPDEAKNLTPELARARSALLGPFSHPGISPRESARQILSIVARKAFRRPVDPGEIDRFLTLFERSAERGDPFEASLRLALQGVLISPHFLFLVEPEPDEGGIHPLPALPLASRLSYFIWSSMPDEELLSLAASDELLNPEIYRQQVRRLLADPKADALGERFAIQWLDLQRLNDEVHPDPDKFPEFDPDLASSMTGEVVAFFNHIFRYDRSLLELIDSDYSFVNERLAQLYELDGIHGADLQKVSLSDRNRGGIVSMAAIHALTSYPQRTSPVLRGKWIMEAILGDRVQPPPPDAGELEESEEAIAHLTLREQLELHRVKPECAACHDRMDPLGFGLENFDVLGRWRELDRGLPIDASGILPSGETFTGPTGLKQLLMTRKEPVLRNLIRKMAGFALGRDLTKLDECIIDNTMEALEANHYRASIVIEQIVTSLPFQHRFYPKQDS